MAAIFPSMHRLLSVIVLLGYFGAKAGEMEDCKPQQTHLAYGDTTREMVVMWSTIGQCSTTVKWGDKDMWKLTNQVPGESRFFNPASNEDGVHVIHRVKLRDLPEGKTIYYQPISNGVTDGKWFFKTPEAHFEPVPTSAPPRGNSIDDEETETAWHPALPDDDSSATPKMQPKFDPVEFLIVNDFQTSSTAITRFNEEAASGRYSAILHVGNLAMNLSSDAGKNADNFFEQIEPAVASVPYMTTPGELEMESGLYSHYVHRLSMPGSEWPITMDRMWYSIDIGMVHLISFCTDTFYTESQYETVQHDWLIRDIRKANENRDSVPWVVAFGREPLYCSYEDPDMACHQKMSKVRKGLEDIFYSYGVDIVVQANGRGYERSLPMYKGVAVNDNYTNPLGPVFIINGGVSDWDPEFNFTDPEPEWMGNRITNHTTGKYGRLRLVNSTVAEFDEICFEHGTVLDTFTILQENHGRFSTEALSPNITKEIKEEMKSRGEKPDELDIEVTDEKKTDSSLSDLLQGDNKTRVIVGATFGSFVAVVLLIVVYLRRKNRRNRVTRRWEHMDINYGKKYYDKAPDQDEDNDFEIDMIEDDTEPSRKLLSDD